jgi:hypothetical protein
MAFAQNKLYHGLTSCTQYTCLHTLQIIDLVLYIFTATIENYTYKHIIIHQGHKLNGQIM